MLRTKKQPATIPQETEKPPYVIEWEASGVSTSIIAKNIEWRKGESAYECLLWGLGNDCRTNSGQLRQKWLYRYNHLWAGGWLCTTLDPHLNFTRSEWGCFKPLEPKEKDGKQIKYEHPPQTPTRAFYLEIGEEEYTKISELWEVGQVGDFWPWVLKNPSIPVVITEGAKKAGALLSHGYVAVALPGVNNGYRTEDKEKELIPDLQILAAAGREIILAFDKDSKFKTQKNVATAACELGKLFEAEGCRVTVAQWNPEDGKGIDDYIVAHGEEKLHAMMEGRTSLAEFKETAIRKVRKFTQSAHFLDFLRECDLDSKLKFNELTLEIELNGQAFDQPEWFHMWFQDRYSVEISENIFLKSVNYFAYNNRYHPVRNYLESVADLPPVDLDTAAARYFGLHDPISNLLLKRWLIGAVARVNRPGSALQGALILHGDGGLGKSTWFKKLGGEFYGGDVDDIRGKDNLLKQHGYWIIECQEFEQITSKSQAAALKAWITVDVDQIRPPYGRKASPHKRGFAIGGSCNNVEFLNDPTGTRRFWILDVGTRFVNHHLLDTERDNLWAAAVQAYNRGERWHLNAEEEKAINQGNQRYAIADDWEPTIEQYCASRNAVCVLDILTQALGFNEKDITRRESMRVTNVLTTLKWRKLGQRREVVEGRYRRATYWIRGEISGAIEQGKLPRDVDLDIIKEIDLRDLPHAECLYLTDYTATTPEIGIASPNAIQDKASDSLAIPAIPPEEKLQKDENPKTGCTETVPEMTPWKKGRMQQINMYKQALGWSNEQLREKCIEITGKSAFLDLEGREISQFEDALYRLIPKEET